MNDDKMIYDTQQAPDLAAFEHKSVMLKEAVDSLRVRPDGVYVDLTCGRGGHSAEILKKLSARGKLICFDRDPDAVAVIRNRFAGDRRVVIVPEKYSFLGQTLDLLNINGVDGILADLGVSSYQLDTPERGFSFHADAPLDMRMSKEGMSAADIVNTYTEQQLTEIFFRYGEERFSRRIATHIVHERTEKPVTTTGELVELIKQAIPAAARRTGGHPARQIFQALRIETNNELDELQGTLQVMFDRLRPGGRLSIITFHSLEDRIVKTFFFKCCQGCICPPELPVCVCGKQPQAKLMFKSKTASARELEENPRARSARLRCIEKK